MHPATLQSNGVGVRPDPARPFERIPCRRETNPSSSAASDLAALSIVQLCDVQNKTIGKERKQISVASEKTLGEGGRCQSWRR
jgi:hypothetical protein